LLRALILKSLMDILILQAGEGISKICFQLNRKPNPRCSG